MLEIFLLPFFAKSYWSFAHDLALFYRCLSIIFAIVLGDLKSKFGLGGVIGFVVATLGFAGGLLGWGD